MTRLPEIRQFFLLSVLFLMVIQPRLASPFMVAGFIFAIVHILMLEGRAVVFKRSWFLFLPAGYYLFQIVYCMMVGTLGDIGDMYMRRVALLMVPFLFFDLRPSRWWGNVIVLSTIAAMLLALAVAVYHSVSMVDGRWTFMIADPWYFEEGGYTVYGVLRTGRSYFTYGPLCFGIGVRPGWLGFGVLLSMIIVSHRLLTDSKLQYRWLYVVVLLFLFVSMFLISSRTNMVSGIAIMVVTGLYYLFIDRLTLRRGLVLFVFLVVGFGVLYFSRMNFVHYLKEDSLAEFVEDDARFRQWVRLYHDAESFLPWGLGPASSKPYHQDLAVRTGEDMVLVEAHNEMIETLVEYGIPGLFAYLILLVVPIVFFRRFAPVHLLLFFPVFGLALFESTCHMAATMLLSTVTYCLAMALMVDWNAREGQSIPPFI